MDTPHEELIDAANLLCEYVQQNIPEGYSIELSMSRAESTISLCDEDGNDIQFDSDRGYSAVVSAVDAAIDDAAEE